MKKIFREPPSRANGRFHDFRPTPLAFALIWLFPATAQAALNLPPFQIDPALLQPAPAPRRAAPAPAAAPATELHPAAIAAASMPQQGSFLPVAAAGPAEPDIPAAANSAEPVESAEPAEPLPLKSSKALTVSPPPDTKSTPIFIRAQRIQGHQDVETEAIGDAELRQWGQVVTADHLRYNKPDDELHAQGDVRIDQNGDIVEGPELKLKLEKNEGFMRQPVFQLNQQVPPGRGDAKMLLFEGENKYRLEDVRYNTCPAGSDDWFIHANQLEIDRTTQVGTARNAYVDFMGVPILYTPWMNFSLNSERKSGFLSPSYGSTGNSGAELTLPYYWNIAPNMDATITPRLMTKRGVQLKNEFRYLEPTYSGMANLEVLPNDRLTGERRDFMSLRHQHNLGGGWTGVLTLEKASDDNYFRDLSTQISVTSQVNLLRDGLLSYAGAGWNFSARSQSFQTLQDPLAPIITPYRRTQFLLNGSRPLGLGASRYGSGLDLILNSELVDFTHSELVDGTARPNATRLTLYPSISLPLNPVYGYIVPKLGLHATRYAFDPAAALPDVTRTLPIFSVDGGLYFDRNVSLFGSSYQQTLEPRVYYVRAPFRDQSRIPLFDSGDFGFGIPQIFTENRFIGGDRISDANQVTLGVTSRFLEESGIERLRGTVAQRYYLSIPQVTLPGGTPPDRKFSDILVSLGGKMTRALSLDSLWQYDPDLAKTSNLALTGRYLPAPGKAFNVGYRYTPATPATPVGLKQIDTSAQWPLTGRWSGLARWNYSILDNRNLESLAGLEYNAGCWAFRAVVHSFATATSERSNSIFFQLELNGVSSIGSNPLEVLSRNIYGYTKTNENPNENTFPETR
ncbi:MAG: LPS-assembly protein LptD [Sulfuricella sp.]|nr:LPS-assembly protein LptD [Sulfuricella sp.]